MIIDKYNLNYLYNKYIITTIIATVIREGFYWLLLYYNNYIKDHPEKMKEASIILLIIYGLNSPAEKLYINSRNKLCSELDRANYHYFNNKILNISKDKLLNLDLIKYNNTLFRFIDNIEDFIINIKNEYDIPIRSLTIIYIAFIKKYNSLYFILPILYIMIIHIYSKKILNEESTKEKELNAQNVIKDYIINSKNLLMNNSINTEYLQKLMILYDNHTNNLRYIDEDAHVKIVLIIYVTVLVIIKNHFNEIDPSDFIYYFIIIYDIEFFTDKVGQYYDNKKNYSGIINRLNYLNSFVEETKNDMIDLMKNNLLKIHIAKIKNEKPKLFLKNDIVINSNDHILIDGESGSGKTSLFYIFKNIIKPDVLDITLYDMSNNIISTKQQNYVIDIISKQSFIMLSGQRNLYNGKLYNIISDHNKYDENIIKKIIELAKFNYKENIEIDINKLSGGEKSRLLIAKLLYINEINNYSMYLLDEIDENLDKETAYEVCQNILEQLKNKIILYITHNNHVKKLFKKVIIVNRGEIELKI